MKSLVTGMALAAAVTLTGRLDAQQHAAPQGGHPAGAMAPPMAAHVQRMATLDARLDSAVARMNRATGDARTGAMQDVLRELVAAHKEMMGHMGEMASHHPMPDSAGTRAPMLHQHPMPAAARPDSTSRPRK